MKAPAGVYTVPLEKSDSSSERPFHRSSTSSTSSSPLDFASQRASPTPTPGREPSRFGTLLRPLLTILPPYQRPLKSHHLNPESPISPADSGYGSPTKIAMSQKTFDIPHRDNGGSPVDHAEEEFLKRNLEQALRFDDFRDLRQRETNERTKFAKFLAKQRTALGAFHQQQGPSELASFEASRRQREDEHLYDLTTMEDRHILAEMDMREEHLNKARSSAYALKKMEEYCRGDETMIGRKVTEQEMHRLESQRLGKSKSISVPSEDYPQFGGLVKFPHPLTLATYACCCSEHLVLTFCEQACEKIDSRHQAAVRVLQDKQEKELSQRREAQRFEIVNVSCTAAASIFSDLCRLQSSRFINFHSFSSFCRTCCSLLRILCANIS